MTGSLPMAVTVVMAAVMGGTALYCAGRLVVAPLRGRATDRSADLVHVVMGTVMAAALLGVLNRSWDLVWVLGFLAAALGFVRAAVVGGAGAAMRHRLRHGSACLAMVVMLAGGSASYAVGPAGAGVGATNMPGMGAMSPLTGSGALGGVLILSLAVGVLAMAAGDLRLVGASLIPTQPTQPTQPTRPTQPPAGRPMLAPRCAAGCRVAMGLTMAVALLTML